MTAFPPAPVPDQPAFPPAPDFLARLDGTASDIEAVLENALSAQTEDGEIARPERLRAAMRHAALGGGKRLRPFLVVESAALFGVPRAQALLAGAALECVHCYSLAHDDLPAMDNDDLRRGRPTLHRAYDEATAILAGDSLLTLAFDLMAREAVHRDAAVRIGLVRDLARAAGLGGMAGGQMLDLAAEGRFGDAGTAPDEAGIVTLQRMKTGALLAFACRAGAILGQAGGPAHAALETFGEKLGLAFQLADDLLDLEGDAALIGKATGKDAAAGKGTLVARLGPQAARQRLAALVGEAEAALAPFGPGGDVLRHTVRFAAARRT